MDRLLARDKWNNSFQMRKEKSARQEYSILSLTYFQISKHHCDHKAKSPNQFTKNWNYVSKYITKENQVTKISEKKKGKRNLKSN